jgi:hypothetical protein
MPLLPLRGLSLRGIYVCIYMLIKINTGKSYVIWNQIKEYNSSTHVDYVKDD